MFGLFGPNLSQPDPTQHIFLIRGPKPFETENGVRFGHIKLPYTTPAMESSNNPGNDWSQDNS